MTANPGPILVTGSDGFIGSALMARLLAHGYSAIGLGRDLDLSDWEQVQNAGATLSVDTVIHLAARTFVPESYNDPRAFYRNNFLSTLNALELARCRQARFVLAGTPVYGTPQYLPVDELHPTSPANPYMAGKIIAEQLCAGYRRDFGLPVVVLRLFNVFGPGQRGDFLLPRILNGLAEGRICLRDPAPRRDFVYIDDVVDAFLSALSFRDSNVEIFNIGSGRSVSVADLAELVLRLSGRAASVEYDGQTRPREIADIVADIRKAGRVLGWAPRITLEDGIRRILAARGDI